MLPEERERERGGEGVEGRERARERGLPACSLTV